MTFWNGTRWVPDGSVPELTHSRGRRLVGAAAEALLIATVISGLVVGNVLAGRGGNGGGRNSTPPATLAAECDPCQMGVVRFSGAGYDAEQAAAQLWVSGAGSAVPVFEDGSVSFGWYFSVPATYELRLYQKGNGRHKLVLMSTTFVTIE